MNQNSLQINYSNLNAQQKQAVQHIEGPIMIIAGPGSGKTRVITERIAYLISTNINPGNILALTFTNKAANEMKKRIHEITQNQEAYSIWMGTFHSIFAKILRKEAHIIQYQNNFTIYDNEDSLKIIRRIIKDKKLDKEVYQAKYIFSRISIMKNQLIDHKEYKKNEELINYDKINKRTEFINIFNEYSNICHQSNCMDFDDLLLNTYYLFRDNPEILEKYQVLFKYILIDEYQDTNKVQDKIIKQLGEKYKNICIVGDDSQSIYSFRGANVKNMLNFKFFYKNVQEFKLEQNYRSTKNIVTVANTLISNNKEKIDKTIFSSKENGEKIQLIEYYNDREEGDRTASIIEKSIQHTKKSEHAILYRTNSQSKVVEDGLRKRGIKYKIFGGLSFYQRKEIKDIMAFLKLIVNHNDDESLLRIINYPTRGIGNTTITKIRQHAVNKRKSIWNLLNSKELDEINFTKNTKNKLIIFKNILEDLFDVINENIFKIIELLEEKTGIIKKLEADPTEDNINKLKNIGELFNSIKLFSVRKNKNTLIDFINEVSLDESKEEVNLNKEEYVSLMTIHQSKGLEFSHIYILGVENGLFPSERSIKTLKGVEEERRLFYVAITRAIKTITISYTLNRFQFGTMIKSTKSFFLDEIDNHLQKTYSPRNNYTIPKNRYFKKPVTPKLKNQRLKKIKKEKYKDHRNLEIGQKITHNIFGKGEIQMVDNSDGNEKITVLFSNNERKILLTKFAKFEIIS